MSVINFHEFSYQSTKSPTICWSNNFCSHFALFNLKNAINAHFCGLNLKINRTVTARCCIINYLLWHLSINNTPLQTQWNSLENFPYHFNWVLIDWLEFILKLQASLREVTLVTDSNASGSRRRPCRSCRPMYSSKTIHRVRFWR